MSSRHPWYGLARWQKRRKAQLQEEPLCRYCKNHGRRTPGTTADHITPHRGDYDLFWYGDLQSLCTPCHNSLKQKIEAQGYDHRVGEDGLPLDPNHPFFRRT